MNKHHENRRARRTSARIGRILLPACLMALLVLISVSATMALLTDQTADVVNTFTVGDVDITLTETKYNGKDADGKDSYASAPAEGVDNSYPMIPGKKYTKDPVVTVETPKTNIPVYLFVEMNEANDAAKYLIYTPTLTTANGWTQGTGTIPSNVWYRTVNPTDPTLSWNLLDKNEITVNSNKVLKTNMDEAAKAKLSFKAYAIQTETFSSVEDAWKEVSK